ncbi:winged-helix domain-containing protein [Actinosynnema sp. NPDC053489]|uniref:winged-helix domain-containing protein n=1 Tax=Actinosynnema sp. NPDC053489 TaxID=3363916 RepID=UPI0037C91CDD
MHPILLLSPDPATARGVATALAGRFPVHRVDTVAHARHALAGDPSLQAVVLALAPAPPRFVLGQVSSFAAGSGRPVIVVADRRTGPAVEELFAAGAAECLADDAPAAEVAARLAAIVRRARWSTARTAAPVTPAEGDDLVVGGLVLDTGTRTATVDHRPVHLSNREFDLLVHLARRPGEVVGRRELLDALWGGHGTCRVVNACVTRLRRRLEESAGAGGYLQAVFGVGVKLAAPLPRSRALTGSGTHRADPVPPAIPDQARRWPPSC